MFREAEGVFNHTLSFHCKQSRERFHQRYYQSFPCLANPLISISAGAGGAWRGRRGGGTGAAAPQAMGGPSPCPLCPWTPPSLCFVPKSTARICPGRSEGLLGLSWTFLHSCSSSRTVPESLRRCFCPRFGLSGTCGCGKQGWIHSPCRAGC